MDGWYYKLFDADFGPVTFEDLVELAKNNTLSRADQVRFGEEGPWRQAGSIGPLMAHFPFEASSHVITKSAPRQVEESSSVGIDDFVFGDTSAKPASSTAANGSAEVDTSWYCRIHDNDFGPLTFDELIEMAKVETLSRDDEVRLGQKGNWRRAGSIGPLMAHFPFQAAKHVVSKDSQREFEARRSAAEFAVMNPPMPAAPVMYGVPGGVMPQMPVPMAQMAPAAPMPQMAPVAQMAVPQMTMAPAMPAPAAPVPAVTVPPMSGSHASMNAIPESPTSSGLPWWVLIQDKEYGPIEYSRVLEWVETGRIHPEDHLRCGREAYRLASDVPGLFPERPTSTGETRSDVSTTSGTQSMPVARSKAGGAKRKTSEEKIEAWLSEKVPTPPPAPAASPDTAPVAPAAAMNNSNASMNAGGYGGNTGFGTNPGVGGGTNSGFGGGSMGGSFGGGSMASNRPMAPIKRPSSSSKSSGNLMETLTGPVGMGVGGTILAVVLIYFALPYIPLGDSADVKNFKKLRDAVNEVTSLRNGDNVRPDQFKPVKANLEKVAKSVLAEVKDGKSAGQKKIKDLAEKVQKMAKEDLAKPTEAEKTVNTKLVSTAKALKVK